MVSSGGLKVPDRFQVLMPDMQSVKYRGRSLTGPRGATPLRLLMTRGALIITDADSRSGILDETLSTFIRTAREWFSAIPGYLRFQPHFEKMMARALSNPVLLPTRLRLGL